MSQRQLVPCPSCNRHVFADACVCPFCSAACGGHSCAPPPPRGGLGRAARMAAAASLLGVSACLGGQSYGTMGGTDADANRAATEQAATAPAASSSDVDAGAPPGAPEQAPGLKSR